MRAHPLLLALEVGGRCFDLRLPVYRGGNRLGGGEDAAFGWIRTSCFLRVDKALGPELDLSAIQKQSSLWIS